MAGLKNENKKISVYVEKQIKNFFMVDSDISKYIDGAILRAKKAFSKSRNKYYLDEKGKTTFDMFHSGQYSIFLYYLSNEIFKMGNPDLANKVYYLNKVLHSVDWYYEIELPEVFGVEHPLNSVLGRATYKSGLFVYQGCTVGGNQGMYPSLGENVILFANSTILGNSNIGNNVLVSANTLIIDKDVPDNSLVFNGEDGLIIKKKDKKYIEKYIKQFWK